MPSKSLVLGFLTVRATPAGGYRGGYLLVSEYGRPIEFHYTNELRLSRAQQLLYGDRAEELLFAEVLGKPLTDRQSQPPQAVLVDRGPLLDLRRRVPAPVLLVTPAPVSASPHPPPKLDAGVAELALTTAPDEPQPNGEGGTGDGGTGEGMRRGLGPAWNARPVRSVDVVAHEAHPGDRKSFDKLRERIPKCFDWLEPFERLEGALKEVLDPLPDVALPPGAAAA